MSFIPDVRHRTMKCYPFEKTNPDDPNNYWQGYMDDAGVDEMVGYDYAAQEAQRFFENLDCYDELSGIAQEQAQKLKDCMLDWIERGRDEMGTSIIDGMDEDEWQRIRDEVDSGKRHNYCTDMKDDDE